MLGDDVTCDGFLMSHSVRVQTHVHRDHMEDFDTSKGYQEIIVTSSATRDLLIAEFDADLQYRSNILPLQMGEAKAFGDCEVVLHDSGHMLGSVQVQVSCSSGLRCGYSGDFAWPLETVIQVEELVVDSTYGSPGSVRRYAQETAEARLVDIVLDRIQYGPILLRAHRGTLHRALCCLNGTANYPIVVHPRLYDEVMVYQAHGSGLPDVVSLATVEGKGICVEDRHIGACSHKDAWPVPADKITTIELSAYWTGPDEPVLAFSDRSYRVALSSHADFLGTLEYVRATGAKRALTDNSRGGHAVELAVALTERLGIEAEPSRFDPTNEWGL